MSDTEILAYTDSRITELEKEIEQLKAYESHWDEIEEDAKRIAEENAELSNSVLEFSNSVIELTNSKTELENKVTELEKQIEKMKCCGNCSKRYECTMNVLDRLLCDKWEFAK